MILVLSAADDDHVPEVVGELERRRVEVFRFDPAEFPARSEIVVDLDDQGLRRNLLRVGGRELDLTRVTAVWLRRPGHAGPEVPSGDRDIADWTRRMASAAIAGVVDLTDCLWVPARPRETRAAADKLRQLRTAASLGFRVPRTRVTNSPDAFLEFHRDLDGRMIAKTLADAVAHDAAGNPIPTYTTPVERRHALNAQAVRHAPTIFQAYVPKRVELRITVVGDRVFPVAIESQSSRMTRHDWRHYDDEAVAHARHALPAEVERRCLLLLRHYDLCFGAIDMVLTPDGQYVFLELNPNGQWAWIADLTGEPIAAAIAELLAGAGRPADGP